MALSTWYIEVETLKCSVNYAWVRHFIAYLSICLVKVVTNKEPASVPKQITQAEVLIKENPQKCNIDEISSRENQPAISTDSVTKQWLALLLHNRQVLSSILHPEDMLF